MRNNNKMNCIESDVKSKILMFSKLIEMYYIDSY